jgi:Ca2+-binding EF-hand superfamily protein
MSYITRSSALAKQAMSTIAGTTNNNSNNNSSNIEKNNLLKRAFRKYDVDGDGFISVDDLQRSFKPQGRNTPQSELVAWVRRRDLSSIGAVCLEDFLKSYSN